MDNLPSLATPADMVGQPGGPFTQADIDAAAGALRAECRWHIAPSVTETLVLDSPGGPDLVLPTLYVREVTAVRVLGPGDVMVPASGWSVRTGWSRHGLLHRPGGFPRGYRTVEVDLTHGYDSCPPELLRVLAVKTRARISAETLQGHTVSFFGGDAWGVDPVQAAYTIHPEA